MAQYMLSHEGWRAGLWAFAILGLAMLPAAFVGGGADRLPNGTAAVGCAFECVVVNDDEVIFDAIHVEFDCVHAPGYCEFKSGEGVFRQDSARAAVAMDEDLGGGKHLGCDQE